MTIKIAVLSILNMLDPDAAIWSETFAAAQKTSENQDFHICGKCIGTISI